MCVIVTIISVIYVTNRWKKFNDVFVDPYIIEFLANFTHEFWFIVLMLKKNRLWLWR